METYEPLRNMLRTPLRLQKYHSLPNPSRGKEIFTSEPGVENLFFQYTRNLGE